MGYLMAFNVSTMNGPAIANAVWSADLSFVTDPVVTGYLLREVPNLVWDEALAGHATAGTAGAILGNLDDAVAAVQADTDNIQTRLPAALRMGLMDCNVRGWDDGTIIATPNLAGVPRVDTDYWNGHAVPAEHTNGYPIVTVKDGTATGEIDTVAGRVQITEAQIDQIVDEVWDELLAGHVIAGSAGDALADAAAGGGGGGADPWLTALPGAYGIGTAGYIVGNLDDAVAAVQADTNDLQARVPAALVGGRMSADVGSWRGDVPNTLVAGTVQGDVEYWRGSVVGLTTPGGTVPANVEHWRSNQPNNLITGRVDAVIPEAQIDQIASEVAAATPAAPTALQNADALLTRDLSAVVGAAARSPLNALRFLRNRWTLGADTLTVMREDDTTPAWTATVGTEAGADPVVSMDPG